MYFSSGSVFQVYLVNTYSFLSQAVTVFAGPVTVLNQQIPWIKCTSNYSRCRTGLSTNCQVATVLKMLRWGYSCKVASRRSPSGRGIRTPKRVYRRTIVTQVAGCTKFGRREGEEASHEYKLAWEDDRFTPAVVDVRSLGVRRTTMSRLWVHGRAHWNRNEASALRWLRLIECGPQIRQL